MALNRIANICLQQYLQGIGIGAQLFDARSPLTVTHNTVVKAMQPCMAGPV